jgi:phosphatidate phosphatase PAH1
VAETSASLRRGLGAVSGDRKTSPKADPKRERVSATTKASDDVHSDDELQKNKRDQEKDDASSDASSVKEKETLATLAAMEATVARLASTLRAREKELDDTRATVATLVRERGERERAFEERLKFPGRPDEIQKTETSRRSPAAAALAKARTLANRNRRDRPVSRARAFTSTKSHGYE